jgi:hypothetical protein
MSSKRRRAASRANGKKSRGPVTPEGKARPAANAPVSDGLASPERAVYSVCLQNEEPEEFRALSDDLVFEHAPVTTTEHLTVHEMATARWRHNRALSNETALLDRQMDQMIKKIAEEQDGVDEPTRAALAFRELADESSSLALLHRYEIALAVNLTIASLVSINSVLSGRKRIYQANLIPKTDTSKMAINFKTHPPTRSLATAYTRRKSDTTDQPPVALRFHPKWDAFLDLLNRLLLAPYPAIRPPFLKLLTQVDLLRQLWRSQFSLRKEVIWQKWAAPLLTHGTSST